MLGVAWRFVALWEGGRVGGGGGGGGKSGVVWRGVI